MSRLTVFVIDDRRTNLTIVAKLAQALPSEPEVRSFADPQTALAAAESGMPDLVVTDYNMPSLDGAAFVRRFRQLSGGPDVPVIVVTAYDDRRYRQDALQAGATDFLLTPLDRAEFCARAENLLTLRRQQRIIQRRAERLKQRLRYRAQLDADRLWDSERKFWLLVNTVPALINAVDVDGGCAFINDQQAAFLGVDPDSVIGQDIETVFGAAYAHRHRELNRWIARTGDSVSALEEELVDATGVARVVTTTKAPVFDRADRVATIVTVATDITERKRLETELRRQAHFDDLTGLPNRSLAYDRITTAVRRAERAGCLAGVFYIDLDGFKRINDGFGHSAGDAVLQAAASRIAGVTRESDTLARIGGDELVMVVDDLTHARAAETVAQRVRSTLATPVTALDRHFPVDVSVGITVTGAGRTSPETLLQQADAALYEAKAQGGSRWAFYNPDMTTDAQRRVRLDADLRRAVNDDSAQFWLATQPICETASVAVTGYEGLARWWHADEGWIPPSEFVPLAEISGLIDGLGLGVLAAACRWGARQSRAGTPVRIGVNVAPVQLADERFVETIEAVLADTGLPPAQLELEVTENALVRDETTAVDVLSRVRARGVSIALDDFGTGHSSLEKIGTLPVDCLKIDKTFLRGAGTNERNRAITATAFTLGRQLGLRVVAEGVETQADLDVAREIGIDEVQGFFLGRPQAVARLGETA